MKLTEPFLAIFNQFLDEQFIPTSNIKRACFLQTTPTTVTTAVFYYSLGPCYVVFLFLFESGNEITFLNGPIELDAND